MSEKLHNNSIYFVASLLILAAAATRILPHPDNFTAIGALALFSGFVFRNRSWSYLLPWIALFLTDLIIGFHFSLLPVYGCIALNVWMGKFVSQSNNWLRIGVLAILSSTVFYLVTNLPFWYLDLQLYPMTLEGTLLSYENALPFYRNQLAADLFYSFVLFGIYHRVSAVIKPATA